jgi:hypothetical protein
MKVQVGQYYRWTRGQPSIDDYYHMIVRIERVLATKAEFTVIEHAPDYPSSGDSYPIGRKSSLLLFDYELPVGTGWELLDDFEYWVKECRKQNEPKKNKRKRTKL